MQVTVQNESTVVVDVQQQETIVVEVDQGRAGRGIQNITYTEVSGQYFLIVTYTDGTTETLGPLVVTGGAAFLLGGATGSIPYQSAPNTTVFLPIGTQNQVVVAGATAPQYTSALTGLTVNNSAIGNTAPSTGAFTNLSASGTFALTGDQVQISEGGTGQTTANGAFNALAPSQTGNAGKYLKTDGTNSSWDQLDISTADITGTLPIANGGTGQTTANSALNALLPTQAAQSGKYLKTDGTNASWDQLDISTADITGVLPIANGGTGASTAAGARANLSAAILGTNNDITSMTGLTGGISTPDFVQFDTTATEANAVGKVYWDASQGTLDLGLLGGNVITRIGQTLVAYVTNAEAVTITKGQVVYLFGAQGDRATVKLAYNTSDATSAKTFGVVAENIGPNQTGFVMCQGVLEGLNLGAFTAGDTLYLGATPGSLTATKPAAPNHLVYVGLVERANPGNGQLYVKVQNGYELDEIHDVQIINPQNGQTILYDASTSLWKNANLTAGSGISVTNGAALVTIGNTGVLSFSGGTTGLTPATSTTGAVTLGGTLAVASGGTGATTAGGALTNLGAASSAITISAGTGLTGGGDLTANRTLSIANTTVTAASYGSASSVGTFTVNAQGQLTAAASTPIAIANTQVSGLGTMSTQNSNSVTITGGSITGITDLAIADGGTGASDAPTARTNLGLGTSATLNAGVALGVATLDAGGTVPLSQLPASIQGGVSYQGSWDAATNTPTIVSSVGTKGYYYVVSVAGSTNINGISDWLPGDWIIFNGSIWQKIDNTDAVASVNGYTGVVVLNAADVGAAPTSRTITAGTGLTGGGDLSANRTISIANTTVAAGSYGSASSVGTFTVNGQGQLTAAASTPIAITNTQVSGLGTMSTQNAGSVAITGGTIDGTTIGGTTRAAGSFTTLTLTNALSVANGGTGTTTSTGTGSVVLSSSPTLTTPNLGTPSAATLTNATGLPLTTGVTGTLPIGNGGTGQTTANAAFNALAPSQTGNAGKYLTTDGTNTSWATNPLGTVTSVDVSGGTTGLTTSGGPITSSGTITLGGTLATTNGGTGLTSFTANRVLYASSTSAIAQSANLTFDGTTLTAANFADSSLTSGRVTYAGTGGNLTDSANLTFDGTVFANNGAFDAKIDVRGALTSAGFVRIAGNANTLGTTSFDLIQGADSAAYLYNRANAAMVFGVNNAEAMRLTTTGLGIGTSSPSVKLDVFGRAKIDVGTYASGYALTLGAISETGRTYQIGMVTGGSLAIYDSAAAAQRVVLDTSGNLGLGVTPSSWGSGQKAFETQAGSLAALSTSLFDLVQNTYNSGTGYIYKTTAAATVYRQTAGQHLWFNAASGTAGATVSFTQAMTLNASGNLGIGTSSPVTKLDVRGNTYIQSNSVAALSLNPGTDTVNSLFGITFSTPTYAIARILAQRVGAADAAQLLFYTSPNGDVPNLRMTLDQSGNLGLGVTPSAFGGNYRGLQIGGNPVITGANAPDFCGNAYHDGTNWRYIGTNFAARYSVNQNNGGIHAWFTAASGTAGNAISFTQAMTLTAAGDLGVGTTSPGSKLDVSGNVNASNYQILGSVASQAGTFGFLNSNGPAIEVWGSSSANAGAMLFKTAGSERARITSGGELLVGTTTTSGGRATFAATANYGDLSTGYSLVLWNTPGTGTPSNPINVGVVQFGNPTVLNSDFGKIAMIQENATTSTASSMRFYTNAGGGNVAVTERARISADGTFRVKGAGTAGSTDAVQFAGSAPASSLTLDASGNLLVGTTSNTGGGRIEVVSNATSAITTRSSASGAGQTVVAIRAVDSGATEFANAQYNALSHAWRLSNGTAALTLNASGNLGVGTTSPLTRLHVDQGADANGITLAYSGRGASRVEWELSGVVNEDCTWVHNNGTNRFVMQIMGRDYVIWRTNNTERARITSGGDLYIGTTANYGRLTVQTDGTNGSIGFVRNTDNGFAAALDFIKSRGSTASPTAVQNGDGILQIRVAPYQGSAYTYLNSMAVQVDGTYTAGQNPPTRIVWNTNAANGSSTERARITSGGKWLVNTTSTAFPGIELVRQTVATDEAISVWNDTTTGDSGLIKFYTDSGAGRGSITYNRGGGVVAYNTTSDYRAKDIIGPVANPGATIDALKVYMGKMKGATIERPMMIAHEAQAVTPYAVTGEKDAVNDKGEPIYQAMDHQVLVPLLIAELQSLRARVAQLEAK